VAAVWVGVARAIWGVLVSAEAADVGDGLHSHSSAVCAALGCAADADAWHPHPSGPYHVVVPLCAFHIAQLEIGEAVEYVLVLHGTALAAQT
jgi:hypothetical protein